VDRFFGGRDPFSVLWSRRGHPSWRSAWTRPRPCPTRPVRSSSEPPSSPSARAARTSTPSTSSGPPQETFARATLTQAEWTSTASPSGSALLLQSPDSRGRADDTPTDRRRRGGVRRTQHGPTLSRLAREGSRDRRRQPHRPLPLPPAAPRARGRRPGSRRVTVRLATTLPGVRLVLPQVQDVDLNAHGVLEGHRRRSTAGSPTTGWCSPQTVSTSSSRSRPPPTTPTDSGASPRPCTCATTSSARSSSPTGPPIPTRAPRAARRRRRRPQGHRGHRAGAAADPPSDRPPLHRRRFPPAVHLVPGPAVPLDTDAPRSSTSLASRELRMGCNKRRPLDWPVMEP
jgi:hypothetical protein